MICGREILRDNNTTNNNNNTTFSSKKMATIVTGVCKRSGVSLVHKGCPAVNNSLRNWYFSRGIKKIPNKPRRRDGHQMNTYKLYWEDRLKNAAKPPLWIEPQTSIVAPSANVVSPKKSSSRFSLMEKR